MTNFVDLAKEEFEFLISDYGYKVLAEKESRDGSYVTLANVDVGVAIKLLYEHRSAFVFVFIYRLENGELRENPLPIDEHCQIYCFDFNDYLEQPQKMKPAYSYGDDSPFYDPHVGLRNYTREFAKRLRLYGNGLLRGDLSSFPRMEQTIKRRARELEGGH